MAGTGVSGGRRVTDLQRGAFWIYGITAMIMREPVGIVVRHSAEGGLGSWQVQLELLRTVIGFLLISRLFLASGFYFDKVYLRPNSFAAFPKQSYLVDFLFGMLQCIAGLAATTAVGVHLRVFGQLSSFTLMVWLFLIVDWAWLAAAVGGRYSSTTEIAKITRYGTLVLILSVAGLLLARLAGADAVFAEQTALVLVGLMIVYDVFRLIREYESLATS